MMGYMGGGTSTAAGIFHHLGVPMKGNENEYMTGGEYWGKSPDIFEDYRFSCDIVAAGVRGAYRLNPLDQWVSFAGDDDRMVSFLKDYITSRVGEARGGGCGVKNNYLAAVLDQLRRAWPSVRIVRVDRNLDGVRATLKRRAGWFTDECVDHYFSVMRRLSPRDPDFVIDYDRLLLKTADEVGRIANYLGVPVTKEAIAHVVA